MKSEEAQLTRAKRFALVVLFGIVGLTISGMSPGQMNADQQLGRLFDNMAPMHYMEAEDMAKKLRPDPSLCWSRGFLDPCSSCAYLGYGIWHAYGTVTQLKDRTEYISPWQVYLMVDCPTPLYAQVGDQAVGDKSYAQRKDPRR